MVHYYIKYKSPGGGSSRKRVFALYYEFRNEARPVSASVP